MLLKADALNEAKTKLSTLQAKMTSVAMEMAAHVETLLKTVPLKEARQFLRVECGIPASDLKAFAGLKVAFGDSAKIIEAKGVPYAIVKALVATDPDTRAEAIGRIANGSLLDTSDIAKIRKHVTETGNPAQAFERKRQKMVAGAAILRAKNAVKDFELRVTQFVGDTFDMIDAFTPNDKRFYESAAHHKAYQADASDILVEFERLFGTVDLTIDELLELDSHDPVYRLGMARYSLQYFAESGSEIFWGGFPGRLIESDIERRLRPLFAVSHAFHRSARTQRRRMTLPLATRVPEPLSVVELCGGAGGMALGFQAAGYRHAAIFENNADAVATLRTNKPGWKVLEVDIKTADFARYKGVDVLSGGLPCQSFSISGNEKGSEDERNLFTASLKAIKQIEPRAFVFENVVGFKRGRHSSYRADLLRLFDRLGYRCGIHMIDAQDYGVPQSRQRIIVVGIQKTEPGVFVMPERFPEWRTNLGDTLRDLMAAQGWSGADAWADALRDKFFERNEIIVRGEVAPTLTGMRDNPRPKTRKRWAELNVNIAGVPDAAPTNEQAAKAGDGFKPGLTQRMRARIQAFPDAWVFEGKKDSVSQQIANAFPPIMAKAVALAVYSALEGTQFDLGKMLRRSLVRGKRVKSDTRPTPSIRVPPALYLDTPRRWVATGSA